MGPWSVEWSRAGWPRGLGVGLALLAVLAHEAQGQAISEPVLSPKRSACQASSAETRRDLSGSTLTEALQSQFPGVSVVQTDAVGGSGTIIVRGRRTLNSGPPLVYVDGIRVMGVAQMASGRSFVDFVDPFSIDRVEVLRGPAASIQYGMDAADGVILIFTKRGRRGRDSTDAGRTLGCVP